MSDREHYDELDSEVDDDLFADGEPGDGFDEPLGDLDTDEDSDDEDGADWDEDE